MSNIISRITNEKKLFLANEIIESDKYSLNSDGTLYTPNFQEGDKFSVDEGKLIATEIVEGYPFTSPVVDDSLVLWLDGSTGKGKDSVWKDLSEKGNDGQLINFKPNGEYYSGLVDGDFNNWRLYGNAFIDDKGFLHIPDNSSGAESPYVQFNNYTGVWSFAADMFATVANDSGTMYSPSCGISYYDENYNPIKNSEGYTSNGRAKLLPINQWSKFLWNDTHGGENVKYVKVRIAGTYQSNTPYIARRPVFETLPTANTHLSSGWDNTDSGLKFDGIDDYVNCGNNESLDITDDLTIEILIKYNTPNLNISNSLGAIVKGAQGTWVSNSYGLRGYLPSINQSTFIFFLSNGTDIDRLTAYNVHLYYGQYIHIVGTSSLIDNSLRMYLNGVPLINSTRTIGKIRNTSYNLDIGRAYTASYMNGNVKLVRLYNRALTDEEILQNYQAGQCSPLLAMRGDIIG